MKKTTYSIFNNYKKGIAALVAASIVLTGIQVPAFAGNSEETESESTASVSGGFITKKSVTLDLESEDLRDAAITAIRDNKLFEAQDYLGATSDSTKAIKEYEAFFNENPGLYVVDVPDSVKNTLEEEADAELRIFVQKDAKMRKADLIASPSEISRDDATASKDVEFRYGTEKDIILYEPSTDVDTLINGGEDAYYKEPEQEDVDNSDYELTGKEKITFMFVNGSDDAVKFTLKVDDVTYDKVTVSGRKSALKKVLADAGKKKVEETKAVETTKAVEVETTAVAVPAADETTSTVENEATAIVEGETKVDETSVDDQTTAVDETSADDQITVETIENEDTYIIEETTPEVVETTEEATEVVETAEAANEETISAEAETEAETAEVVETAAETEEDEVEATLPEKIAEAVHSAVETVEEVVLGRITAFADENEVIFEAATPSEIQETEKAEKVNKPSDEIATSSEIPTEYDDFAKELIAEAKEAVLEDKESAMENLKVAKIAQYTLDELGKIHYEAEIDGYSVDVFAPQGAFEDHNAKLEVKKLYKPEEEKSGDTLSEDEIAELKANDIYDNSQSLDIRFVDGLGREIEPAEAVKVRITVSDEELLNKIDASSLEVHHLKEENSTLKTEKVASTDDVKALDENDEKISDEDLKADAEAVAEGEEKEVKVASAVAEFEVESFSVYTITWKNSADGTIFASIKAYYVDENGKQILDTEDGSNVNLGADGITLANIHGGVTNYTYKEARLGGPDGQIITSIKPTATKESAGTYLLDYYNGNDLVARKTVRYFYSVPDDNGAYDENENTLVYKVSERDGYDVSLWNYNGGWSYYKKLGTATDKSPIYSWDGNEEWWGNVALYEGQRYTYIAYNLDNSIYFVYKPNDYEQGGDPQVVDLGAPAADKTLSDNGDGTYDLTLSVTGKSQAQTEKTKANVLVVLDLSNSMKNVASDEDKYVESTYGNYYKDGNTYRLLKVRGRYHFLGGYYDYNDATDGTHETVYDRNEQLYTGTRFSKLDKATHLEVAKSAVKSLATTLLANNEDEDDDTVELGLVTYSTRVNTYNPETNAAEFNAIIDGLGVSGGTNWEGGLLAGNAYSFGYGDTDPVYVIFVSDGQPTYRVNANGYYNDSVSGEDVYGAGNSSNSGSVTRCKDAAVKAATALIGANKKLYAVNAFSGSGSDGAESNMKALFGTSTQRYYNAENQATLNAAFGRIIKEIQHDLAYTDVTFVDGISDLTATMEVLGTTDNYRYEITRMNGGIEETVANDSTIAGDNNLKKLRTAKLENGTVTWDLGGTGFRLEDGYTYKVTFTVWPKQEAYDMLADAGNGKKTDADMEAAGFVKEAGKWVYKTNSGATVKYKTVSIDTVDGVETPTISAEKTTQINVFPKMSLTDTKLTFEKQWKLDDPRQVRYFKDDTIRLNLQRKNDSGQYVNYFAEDLQLDGKNANVTTSSDEKTVTWKNNTNIEIAPGILVSESAGNSHGFDKSNVIKKIAVEGTNPVENYYIVEEGHDYRFHEVEGNASFDLQDTVYHPMVVDGTLRNVEFTYKDGKIDKIKSIDTDAQLEELTAINVINLKKLTVSKTYTGNMANPQATTFDLYLYKESNGTNVAAVYDDGYIEGLNAAYDNNPGVVLTKQGSGAYRFTITPDVINSAKTVEITLPGSVSYRIEEVKTGKPYAEYKTKWGTASNSVTHEGAITDVQKLSEVNTIFFENKLTVITPTGIASNAVPFIALALAGVGAMAFLAYDFQRRRLFED